MNKALEFFQKSIGLEANQGSPSPFGQWLNGIIREAEEGRLVVDFKVRPDFTNPAGMIHGGVYAGIFDEVIGMTTFTLGRPEFFAAINLNVDFLRPSKIGETITVKSQVLRAGKSILHIQAELWGEDGKLRAKATSNLAKTTFEHQKTSS
jgi:uncharacterized protein (TIGR00369 family)